MLGWSSSILVPHWYPSQPKNRSWHTDCNGPKPMDTVGFSQKSGLGRPQKKKTFCTTYDIQYYYIYTYYIYIYNHIIIYIYILYIYILYIYIHTIYIYYIYIYIRNLVNLWFLKHQLIKWHTRNRSHIFNPKMSWGGFNNSPAVCQGWNGKKKLVVISMN